MQTDNKKEPLKNKVNIKKLDDTGIVAVTWNDSCTNLLKEEHWQQIEEINNRLEKMKPKKVLIDLHQCEYIISPKTRNWYDNTLFGMFSGSRPDALAFVVPSNLFNHIFFEAGYEAAKVSNIKTQYFREREKAVDWLKSL